MVKYFYAYPSQPSHVRQIIEAAAREFKKTQNSIHLWIENDVVGRPLTDPIFEEIDGSDIVICDITKLNFNVIFEAGYAIAKNKPVILTLNSGTSNDRSLFSSIGIFDTLGYLEYQSTIDLISCLAKSGAPNPLVTSYPKSDSAPIYLVEYPTKSDSLARITSRIKKSHIRYRSFNPQEHTRLSAISAIENVSSSSGVVIPLASNDAIAADIHNIRAAFVSGLSVGFGIPTLILQPFGGPVPLDVRDFSETFKHPDEINDHIAIFSGEVLERMQIGRPRLQLKASNLLGLTVGDPMAENEMTTLSSYFLDTDEYERVVRGEANLVVGRKGTGKTALFTQVRDRIRRNKKNVVVDLKPEGYQLKKLREEILDYITEGAQEHLFVAFWEYILYIEIVYKILEKDQKNFARDPNLTEGYLSLSKLYESQESLVEGDFSERLLTLAESIAFTFSSAFGRPEERKRLTQGEITELIHAKYLKDIRNQVVSYLKMKDSLWILFDNLDKGWPPQGIDKVDTLILRCLIDAGKKIKRDMDRAGIKCVSVVFVRNDVYEILMKNTSDFGKEIRVPLDWSQKDILKEVIRRRISGGAGGNFADIWSQYVVPLYKGEDTFAYFLERSLMRPRNLIKMIIHARGYAINMRKERIEEEAIEKGLLIYANDVLKEADQELSDINPLARDILYKFFGASKDVSRAEILETITSTGIDTTEAEKIISHLLYFAFIGIREPGHDAEYIYDFQYNMKLMEAKIVKASGTLMYSLNPAFWPVLRVEN